MILTVQEGKNSREKYCPWKCHSVNIRSTFSNNKILEAILKAMVSQVSFFASPISPILVFEILFKFAPAKISMWPGSCRNHSLAQVLQNFQWPKWISTGQLIPQQLPTHTEGWTMLPPIIWEWWIPVIHWWPPFFKWPLFSLWCVILTVQQKYHECLH